MKWNKKLGALLLSVALLAGTALPSFAEPEPADTETPAASQTTTDTTPTAEGTDGATDTGTTDTGTTDTDTTDAGTADSNADAADSAQTNPTEQQPAETEQPKNQTGAEAEDGSIQMPTIDIDAKASILVNAETGEIIHANNEKEKMYPASCTKIMTALLALEKCNLDDVVTKIGRAHV